MPWVKRYGASIQEKSGRYTMTSVDISLSAVQGVSVMAFVGTTGGSLRAGGAIPMIPVAVD